MIFLPVSYQLCLAPLVWQIKSGEGFQYDAGARIPLKTDILPSDKIPEVTIKDL